MRRNQSNSWNLAVHAALIVVAIAAVAAAALSGPGRALAAPGTCSLNANYTVNESGNRAISVKRPGGGDGNVVVQVNVTGQTPGSTPTLNALAIFNAGETAHNALININDVSGPATITIKLVTASVGPGYSACAVDGANDTATINIVDAQGGPWYAFGSATHAVSEAVGTFQVPVIRTGDATGTDTVTCSRTGGSATIGAGNDFTFSTQVVSFSPGVNTAYCNVTILDDSVDPGDDNETVILGLGAPVTGFEGGGIAPTTTTLTITDNDGAGILNLGASTYTVAESAGSLTIPVLRTNGSSGSITVNYSTSEGTATDPEDYTAQAGTLTFSNGETQENITIPINTDALVEGAHTFSVTISGGTATPGVTTTAVVTITDDDANGAFRFSSPTYAVSETSGAVVIQVDRVSGATGAASVTFATTSGGNASAGVDYTAVSTTLTFANGEISKTVNVNVFNDAVAELNETFNISLSNPLGGAVLGSPATATVTIVDDETNGPLVTAIYPASGPTTGFTFVTITGQNFTGATSVKFGDTTATVYAVSSSTSISVVSPPHAAGTVSIRVTTPAGTSPDVAADNFTYTGVPSVTSISPSNGDPAGGTVVTINGSGFLGTTSVRFGGINASSFTIVSDIKIMATAPAHAAGSVDVIVTTEGGSSPNTGADNFVYGTAGDVYTYSLSFRWNLEVWVGKSIAAADAVSGNDGDSRTGSISGIVTAMFKWNSSTDEWEAWFPNGVGVPGANDFSTLTPGTPYWIAVSQNTSWTVLKP